MLQNGKKDFTDSANLMNKVFEVIEAKKIFDIDLKKFNIWIHPKSYVHALVKFKNGITKLLIHDTSMKIPIYNALNYYNEKEILKSKNLDFDKLNNLNFSSPDSNKFYSLKFFKICFTAVFTERFSLT